MSEKKRIILIGNPNVGKSTIFNYITGLKQHTGNWTGKTVSSAKGYFTYKNEDYEIVDIPGTYSLNSQSKDEEFAIDYICFQDSDLIVVVCDATSLERNLLLVLQLMELRQNILLCVNLLDEAKKKNININLKELEKILNIPIVATNGIKGEGIQELLENIKVYTSKKQTLKSKSKIFKYEETIEKALNIIEKSLYNINFKNIKKRFVAKKLLDNDKNFIFKIEKYLNIQLTKEGKVLKAVEEAKYYLKNKKIESAQYEEKIYYCMYNYCKEIIDRVYNIKNLDYYQKDLKLDKILTSKKYGIPIMLVLLALIFWITITGANYPSSLLSNALFSVENDLYSLLKFLRLPIPLISILIDGIYKVVCWVVSVMLPPMAIFFPLFSILEDFGYLPRVAFNLDSIFKKCNACGKQALTMVMGFGCNAVGVTGCRIINSPRERLIAILTNNFVPCNGRLAK